MKINYQERKLEKKINNKIDNYFYKFINDPKDLSLNRIIFNKYLHPNNCILRLDIPVCNICDYKVHFGFEKLGDITFNDIIYEIYRKINQIKNSMINIQNKCFCKDFQNNYIKVNYNEIS